MSNTAGSTSLCTIYDLSYLQMTVNVDELEILSIKEGQSVTITADAISDRTFTGVVTKRVRGGHHGRRHHHLSRHHPHRRYRRPAARHERGRRDHRSASAENALAIPTAAVDAGQHGAGHRRLPQRCQRPGTRMTAPEGYVYVEVDHRHQR